MTKRRNVIVHIATSADGYIARPDGDLEWLTSRPAPEGFYGMNAFMRSIDTMLIGRKTYEVSLRMGAKFESNSRTIVFSRHAPPADVPSGVEFVNGAIGPFVSRLRELPGKDIWLMGGGELIASFLDEQAIDEFVISVAPVFIGDGIPLIPRRHGCSASLHRVSRDRLVGRRPLVAEGGRGNIPVQPGERLRRVDEYAHLRTLEPGLLGKHIRRSQHSRRVDENSKSRCAGTTAEARHPRDVHRCGHRIELRPVEHPEHFRGASIDPARSTFQLVAWRRLRSRH